MILIINQHKGSYQELLDSIYNYIDNYDSKKFYQVLRIDGTEGYDESQLNHIKDLGKIHKDKISIIIDENNIGLSPSRVECVKYAFNNKLIDYSGMILFGCTNSRFKFKLTDYVESLLVSRYPTAILCDYENDFMTRSTKLLSNEYVSFSDFISDINKPDFTIMIPTKYASLINCHYDEKYYPEELILYPITKDTNGFIRINKYPLQDAWYNSTGMTKTFSRETMVLPNRKGFFDRAEILLTAWAEGNLNLSMEYLKNLVYDYVTLGDKLNLRIFKNIPLEGILDWALMRWLKNEYYDHTVTFNEDKE